MTRDKYFSMCDQMNMEPKEDEIPCELQDFPDEIQKAIILYNKLGDRIYPDIGYLGKDFITLPLHMDILNIQNRDLFIETLLLMDEKMITTSAKKLKAERDKLARKAK